MGRPKLGAEYKKPSDYHYDYPVQRKIAKRLSWQDKKYIIAITGYSKDYVLQWCRGVRKNPIVKAWALKIASINVNKQRQLNRGIDFTNSK